MSSQQPEELFSYAGISRRLMASPQTIKRIVNEVGLKPFGIVHRGLSEPAEIFTVGQVDLIESHLQNRQTELACERTILEALR